MSLPRWLIAFALFLLPVPVLAADWKPAPAPLMTKWGNQVTPTTAWPVDMTSAPFGLV